jgi:two-component system, response regulator YesN
MMKVVIIDDNPLVLESLSKTIPWSDIGCTLIATAQDGESGIQTVLHEKPDILIADIRMPGLDGLEMTRYLKKEMPVLPLVIFITAYAEFEYAKSALTLGAFNYIMKPIDNDELTCTLTAAVEKLRKEGSGSSNAECPPDLPADIRWEACSPMIRKELKYLVEHMTERISIAIVSEHVGLSPNYLSTLTHKETGMRFSDLISAIKVKQAMKLLSDPTIKIYEVGLMLGYEEYTYFYYLFRRVTGLSPKEFREKNT